MRKIDFTSIRVDLGKEVTVNRKICQLQVKLSILGDQGKIKVGVIRKIFYEFWIGFRIEMDLHDSIIFK